MMVKVITADKDQHAVQIRELFLEHLQWANAKVKEEFEVSFNTAAMLEADMKDPFQCLTTDLLLRVIKGWPEVLRKF